MSFKEGIVPLQNKINSLDNFSVDFKHQRSSKSIELPNFRFSYIHNHVIIIKILDFNLRLARHLDRSYPQPMTVTHISTQVPGSFC